MAHRRGHLLPLILPLCGLLALRGVCGARLRSFGGSYSQYELTGEEQPFLTHTVNDSSSFAVLTHFWVTGNPASYIDNSTWTS